MIVVNCQQGTPEWIAARLGRATASCFGIIQASGRGGGESATRANLITDLALERLSGRQVVGGFENAATRQGTAREAEARLAYEVWSGTLVEQVGLVQHDRLMASASPDGLIDDDGGLEIKAPMPKAHSWVLRTRKVPPVYLPQVFGGMWICRRRWWRFASWNPDFPEGKRLVVIKVERDQKVIDKLAADVEVFLGEVDAEHQAMLRAEGDA